MRPAARLCLLALAGQLWWPALARLQPRAPADSGAVLAFAPRDDASDPEDSGSVLAFAPREAGAPGDAGAGPAFAPGQDTDVLVAEGERAELVCRVLHLGDKAVSWVRSRDLQILAHAGGAFTADARVSAASHGAEHALRLAAARAGDAGRYECQVNTEPKLSLGFRLTVLDERSARVRVEALGARVLRARAGRRVELACAARYVSPPASPGSLAAAAAAGPAAPALALHWTREDGDRQLPLEGRADGVSLEARWRGARVESRVRLARLRPADAGRYRCAAPPAYDTITLHVTESESAEGEQEAEGAEGAEGVEAMQRDQSPPSAGAATSPPLAALALAALLHWLARDFTLVA